MKLHQLQIVSLKQCKESFNDCLSTQKLHYLPFSDIKTSLTCIDTFCYILLIVFILFAQVNMDNRDKNQISTVSQKSINTINLDKLVSFCLFVRNIYSNIRFVIYEPFCPFLCIERDYAVMAILSLLHLNFNPRTRCTLGIYVKWWNSLKYRTWMLTAQD